MPSLAPLKLTLYDPETFEVHGEYYCNFVPLRLLELAIGLAKSLINVNDDILIGLIVDLFGRQFSADELVKYSERNDRMLLLQALMLRPGLIKKQSDRTEPKNEEPEEQEIIKDDDWIIDTKISLMNIFDWSLYEIDETAIETLLPLINRYAGMSRSTVKNKHIIPCDLVPGW